MLYTYFVRDVPSRLFPSTVAKVYFYFYFPNIFLFCLAYRLFWKVSVIRTHVASSKRSILWTMSSQLINKVGTYLQFSGIMDDFFFEKANIQRHLPTFFIFLSANQCQLLREHSSWWYSYNMSSRNLQSKGRKKRLCHSTLCNIFGSCQHQQPRSSRHESESCFGNSNWSWSEEESFSSIER